MKVSWACVQQVIIRHRQVRTTYIQTYSLRHPQRPGPPEKILKPLSAARINEL